MLHLECKTKNGVVAFKIQVSSEQDAWEGEFNHRSSRIVLNLKEFKYFTTKLAYAFDCMRLIDDHPNLEINEVHAGADFFFDFFTVNYEKFAKMYRAQFDFEKRKIYKEFDHCVQFTEQMLNWLGDECADIVKNVPMVTTTIPCTHENQLGLLLCRICRPLDKRDIQ